MNGQPSPTDAPTWPPEFADRYRAAGLWTGQTFGAMLRERAVRHPDREAIVAPARAASGVAEIRWTYAELDQRADELAGGLHGLGVRRGDPVLVQLPNEGTFLEVLLGCMRLGAVPVMALAAHRSSELIHLAAQSEAVALVTCGCRVGFDHAALAAEVQAAVPTLRSALIDGEPGAGQIALGDLRGAPLEPGSDLPVGSDLALLQLSGGTTGLPKLIPRTHDDYRYSVDVSAQVCELDGESRYLAVLPVSHNFPLSSPGALGALWAGGTVVLCPSPDTQTALGLIERERITITGIVPPLAIAWLEALPGSGASVESLRVLQVGGAKLDAGIARPARARVRLPPAAGVRNGRGPRELHAPRRSGRARRHDAGPADVAR